MRSAITILLLISMAVCIEASVPQGQDIHFGPNGQYHGYLVRPSGNGPFPGLVVIHEWWGLSDYILGQSNKLAEAGYVALAVDLFGKTTTDLNEAMKMAQSLDQNAATAQELAAANYLRTQTYVKPDHVGSIGWCFGGRQSLILAINDPKLRTAVIYYGPPITDVSQLSKIRAQLMCFYGEADQTIPMTQIEEFCSALKAANVKFEMKTYPGAPHAFANPSPGPNYRPEAAQDAWKRTINFLKKYLAG